MDTKRISIVLPVIRPDKAERCVTAIKANADDVDYKIISEVDTERIGCPKMVKRLVGKTNGELVMFLGDDTIPKKGFLTEALRTMETLPDGWGLVGLDDGYHREHPEKPASHWLADKRILPLIGGDFFHIGYKHLFCDNELTMRCKNLKRFAWTEDKVIEHDHPKSKGNPLNEEYAKIYDRATYAKDLGLYQVRKKEFTEQPKTAKVLMGMPLHKDRRLDLMTAEFCFKEFSGRQGRWSTRTSEAAADSRNTIAVEMLNDNFTHLFFLDADTIPPLGTVDRLLAHDKDIIAGVTPVWGGEKRWNFRYKQTEPVIYGPLPSEPFRISWVGGSTILIKREVFEKMDWPYYEIYNHPTVDGISHDFWFCEKALNLDFEIWIDPTIICGHMNTVNLLDVF